MRRDRERTCGAVALIAVLSCATPAGAQVRVHADPVSGCPDLATRTAELLGPAFAEEDADATLVLVHEGARWSARLTLALPGSPATEQQLEDASCAAVIDAAALIVAVAVDPDLFSRAADAETEVGTPEPVVDVAADPAPADDPAPILETSEPPPDEPAIEPIPGLGATLRAGSLFGLGFLPDVAVGAELAVGLRVDGWIRVEASAVGLFPQTTRFRPGGEVGADVGLVWGAAGVCLVPAVLRELAIGPCTAFGAGAALGTAHGVPDAGSSAAPVVLVDVSLRIEVTIVRELALVGMLGFAVPFLRPVFTIEGLGRLYRLGEGDGTLRLALEVHLS